VRRGGGGALRYGALATGGAGTARDGARRAPRARSHRFSALTGCGHRGARGELSPPWQMEGTRRRPRGSTLGGGARAAPRPRSARAATRAIGARPLLIGLLAGSRGGRYEAARRRGGGPVESRSSPVAPRQEEVSKKGERGGSRGAGFFAAFARVGGTGRVRPQFFFFSFFFALACRPALDRRWRKAARCLAGRGGGGAGRRGSGERRGCSLVRCAGGLRGGLSGRRAVAGGVLGVRSARARPSCGTRGARVRGGARVAAGGRRRVRRVTGAGGARRGGRVTRSQGWWVGLSDGGAGEGRVAGARPFARARAAM